MGEKWGGWGVRGGGGGSSGFHGSFFFQGKLLVFAHVTLIHFASSPPHYHALFLFLLIQIHFLADITGLFYLTKSLDEDAIQVYHV